MGKGTLWVAQWWIEGEPSPPTEVAFQPALLQQVLQDSLLPAVLKQSQLLAKSKEDLVDPQGAWISHTSRYQLEPGVDPAALGNRLRNLASEALPGADVYVTPQRDLEVDVRFYAGKRLVHRLILVPTLEEPARTHRGDAALVALVVLGLGEHAQRDKLVLEAPLPLSVGLVPYSPFALRMAREATRNHKEILVELPATVRSDSAAKEAYLAVPGATGVILQGPPGALAPQFLADRSMVLLDASGNAEGQALRAARELGVPLLRRHDDLSGELRSSLNRAHHMARKQGQVVLVVDIRQENVPQVLAWLKNADPRDLRPVFLSEIAAAQAE
jgi:polysaccharide deacetylase 2 family uncharacterized protein YibQ